MIAKVINGVSTIIFVFSIFMTLGSPRLVVRQPKLDRKRIGNAVSNLYLQIQKIQTSKR